jgi:hypothetical protein
MASRNLTEERWDLRFCEKSRHRLMHVRSNSRPRLLLCVCKYDILGRIRMRGDRNPMILQIERSGDVQCSAMKVLNGFGV